MSDQHYAHRIDCAPCPGCGQGRIAAGTDARCNRCTAAQYGGNVRHESVRLFEPAPTQLRGQLHA